MGQTKLFDETQYSCRGFILYAHHQTKQNKTFSNISVAPFTNMV